LDQGGAAPAGAHPPAAGGTGGASVAGGAVDDGHRRSGQASQLIHSRNRSRAMSNESHGSQPQLSGAMLWVAAIVLAMANFVTVPNMAGALGAASTQGTWVITSYAVAEAITVPLTGWLASRFGGVLVFTIAVEMLGLSSLLCGMSGSLGMLIGMRVLQGISGGPLMALSQTL